jgi:serine protease inhibitor
MKMRNILILALLSGFILLTGCGKEEGPELGSLSQKTKALIESDNDFGFDLFQRVMADAKPNENLCVSPLSVSLALAMTYNGAAGETGKAMEETLKLAGFTRDEINSLYRNLRLALISDDPMVKLGIANSIWYRNDFSILDDFVTRNEIYYNAQVQSLNFADPGTKDIINDWVSDQTNDKIESIVDQISPQSFMFLINAIFFKVTW